MKHLKQSKAGSLLLTVTALFLFQSCSDNNIQDDYSYGSGNSSSSSSNQTISAIYSLTTGSTTSISGTTYAATATDQSAILVTNGTLTVTNCTVTKSGAASDASGSSCYYGLNSAVWAKGNAATITVSGGSIKTTASGANAVFAYKGKITVSTDTITTTGAYSVGLDAAANGTIVASNTQITTSGANSPVIATGTSGGTVKVTGGTYNATGESSAVINSTGIISASGITGSSNAEAAVINGENYITLTDSCVLTSVSTDRGVLFVQSGSVGTSSSTGHFTMTGGSLSTTNSSAQLFEVVTNSTADITLTGVTVSAASGVLMRVDYNTGWKTYGATGNLIISGSKTVSGNVEADATSSATVTVNSGSIWTGAFDKNNTAKSGTVTINGGTWTLTGNSYIDALTLTNSAVVNKNGYTLTVTTTNNTSGTINN